MKHSILIAALAAASPAFADGHLASADAIRSDVVGNTVEGAMTDGTGYAEYYQADGVIKAAGYTGHWGLVGDKMCFDYGEGVGCWNVKIDGDKLTWMRGEIAEGTGMIRSGNANGF